jgi:protein CpxP
MKASPWACYTGTSKQVYTNFGILKLTKESIMYKKCLWIVALAFSFILSQSAFADSWGCGKGMHEIVGSLKLDDAQKEKIKPILDQLKSSMKDNGVQMKELDKQLNQQVDAANVDQAKVDDLIDQKSKLIGSMMKAKIKAKIQIMPILNDKQKSEMQAMIKKMEDEISTHFKNCYKKK